ncbi:MAG TPA: hypothetical protein VKT77_10690 [Chthonomonadaceae bacterium]|nr:hypothetical protein [Chthonomonadaceae bacterium]
MDLSRGQRTYLGALLVWLGLTTSAVLALSLRSPVHRAVICMATGMILLWIVLGGALMVRFRAPIVTWVRAIPLDWRLKFVLFCTVLAMTEEAITTLMTNAAPLFGVRYGQAYITASGNYLDVITLHSVSIFVSLFVGWAVILWRRAFSPFAVFVLFGITGTLAEMAFGGPQHILEYAMWSYVYGLMVWLPACAVPQERGALPPRWWHYPLAVFAPFLFIVLFPLAGIITVVATRGHGGHPSIHFPPLR